MSAVVNSCQLLGLAASIAARLTIWLILAGLFRQRAQRRLNILAVPPRDFAKALSKADSPG